MWVRQTGDNSTVPDHGFQFTHPCGCDGTISAHQIRCVWFQFTHPCGCDVLHSPLLSDARSFNSRTRVGATNMNTQIELKDNVSIHAPVWVRPGRMSNTAATGLFQFTHPCGCDCEDMGLPEYDEGFNSRTRVGATIGNGPICFSFKVSIHAPVWVRRPDEYGLSIKHATKVLRQPDARTRCGQA